MRQNNITLVYITFDLYNTYVEYVVFYLRDSCGISSQL